MLPTLRTAALLALSIATAGEAGARDLADHVWDFRADDAGAMLFVLPAAELGVASIEPTIPFMMTCAPGRDWTIVIDGEVDHRALGDAVLARELVTLRFIRLKDGARIEEYPREYVPSISFSETHGGTWSYTAIWSPFDGLLEALSEATEIAVEGTGVDLRLPTQRLVRQLAAFMRACGEILAKAGGP